MTKLFGRSNVRVFSVLAVIALLAVAVPMAQVGAASQVLFDSIPATLPGAYASLGYEATSTSEFGDHVAFTLPVGNNRLTTFSVNLTNWACENDFELVSGVWTKKRGDTEACVTTPGTSYNHPITLNIYNVDNSGDDPAPGTLIATKTISAAIPFRPSYDSEHCSSGSPENDVPFGGRWFDPVENKCVHGKAFTIDFDFSAENIILPAEIIYGIAYNTSHYGATPLTVVGPYDALNVSVGLVQPTTGTDVEPATFFLDSGWSGAYCNGSLGLNVFRRDADCWTVDGNPGSAPFFPVIRISSFVDTQGPLASNITVSQNRLEYNSTHIVTLSANLDDSTKGGAFIASAEYQISGQSTWKPMTAVDASFSDSVVENVQATITAAGLGLTQPGTYQLCVRGTDTEGNTSNEVCTTIYVYYFTYIPMVNR